MSSTAKKPNVFISYARKDGSDYASRLYDELQGAGFTPWRDTRNLNPSQDFSGEIETAIRAADYMVVCVTSEVAERTDSFVRREVMYSQGLHRTRKNTENKHRPEIIPLVFPGGFPPPVTIVHLTYIECFREEDESSVDLEGGLSRLFERLGYTRISSSISNPQVDIKPIAAEPKSEHEQSLVVPTTTTLVEMPVLTENASTVEIEAMYAEEIRQEPASVSQEEQVKTEQKQVSDENVSSFVRRETQFLERAKSDTFASPISPVDAYTDYLDHLYDQIVDYLNQTVFSLITLHGTASPDAVIRSERALPMSFTDVNEKEFSNFAEAFQAYNGSLLLLGEPGAGKTTTLMAYARETVANRLEDPSLPLPIFLRIPEWSRDTQPTLDMWIASQTSLTSDTINSLLKRGQLLLLLDGLDELGNHYEIINKLALHLPGTKPQVIDSFDPRQRFIDMLEKSVGTNSVVITCRIKDYAEIGQKIGLRGAIILRPLDDNQMEQYLHDQPDLLTAVRTDAGLHEMVQIPLLLSLLTFAYSGVDEQTRQQLRDLTHSPNDLRAKIIEIYVRRRFEHEAKRSNVTLTFSLDDTYQILGNVAIAHINANKITFGDFKNRGKRLTDPMIHDFIRQMRQMHLLVGDDSNLRFIHLLVRDHFGYEQAIRKLTLSKIEVLGKLGDQRAATALIEFIDKQLKSVFFDFDLSSLKKSIIILGQLANPQAVPILSHILIDKDKSVRSRTKLWKMPFNLFGLLTLMIVFIPCLAVGVVGQNILVLFFGGQYSLQPTTVVFYLSVLFTLFFSVYVYSINGDARILATEALGKINHPSALSALKMVENDSNMKLQQAAKKAIGVLEYNLRLIPEPQ